jgi:multisubunit Na+/H+ antiporter MnhG subunit
VSKATQIRRIFFVCGIVSLAVSVALIVGSFIRPVHSQDYFQQADEARPWISWGLGSTLIGFVFCFFGKRYWRVASVLSALILLFWWYCMGAALV